MVTSRASSGSRTSRVARLGATVVLACMCAAATASASAASLEDYHARVASAIELVAQFQSTDESPAPIPAPRQLEPLRTLLPTTEVVDVDGVEIVVDNAWVPQALDRYSVLESLDDRSAAVEEIAARLFEIDRNIESLASAPRHATPEDRRRLEEILSRSDFYEPTENPVAAFYRRAKEWIAELLADLLRPLFEGATGTGVGIGIRIAIIVIGTGALALLGRAIWQALDRRRSGAVRGKKMIFGEEIDESTTAADLAAAARKLAAAGEYRGAIRRLFVSLIYQLDERELVRLRPQATNREYLALVRAFDRLHPVMAALTDTFEVVWYGQAAIGRGDYDSFEKLHAQASQIVATSPVPTTS